ISCVQSQLIASVPPVSAYQCHLSAHPCLVNVTYECPSELPFSASQCHLSILVSAAYQCHLTVTVSAAYQCHVSVLPFSAHQ
ncbi:unnamed protein product, partial [Staurois parvus]